MSIIKHNNALKAVESHPRGLDYKPTVVGANFVNMKKEDFKLGELVFLERSGRKVKYRCFCGKEFETDFYSVKYGATKSCGCYHKFTSAQRKFKHGSCRNSEVKNQWDRLYEIYMGMKKRCYNPNSKSYCRYGGRGIIICKEWLNSYIEFRDWALTHGYADNLTIDRENNDGDYTPDNCRWVTKKVQAANKKHRRRKPGRRGVGRLPSGRFTASISINDETKHLGTYNTEDEASAVYERAKKERDEMYLKESKNQKS